MSGVLLEFKVHDNGRIWPPIISDGVIQGYARTESRNRVELFRVTEDGLYGQGISYLWSDLDGVSISEGCVKIHSNKHLSGGIQFVLDGVVMKTSAGNEIKQVHGYPVSYCLLNRITFERQRLMAGSDYALRSGSAL